MFAKKIDTDVVLTDVYQSTHYLNTHLQYISVFYNGLQIMQSFFHFQQQQRPDLARLMQIHAAGGLPPSPAALPPGLLGGPGAGPAGLPTSIALLAGIPTSLAQAGPHPAFASLLAQQKPTVPDPVIRPKDEELKRAIADTNGSKWPDIFALDLALLCFFPPLLCKGRKGTCSGPFHAQ